MSDVKPTKVAAGHYQMTLCGRTFDIKKDVANAMMHAHSGVQWIVTEGDKRHFTGSLFTTLQIAVLTLNRRVEKYVGKEHQVMQSYG